MSDATSRPSQEPPDRWRPTQAAGEPVINKPYEEPQSHYVYRDGVPSETPGRRPASYWFRSKKTGTAQEELFAEEERDDLPLVNQLRSDVKRWREADYRGASQVTKDLLRHWSRDDLPRRLFYCQREAAETLIYLLELAMPGQLSRTGFRIFQVDQPNLTALLRGLRPDFIDEDADTFPRLIDPPPDDDLVPLRRLGCKMATGAGKTVVMAMLTAWAFCNRGRNPATRTFPNGILICAPNLTVRKRLQVLRPDHPENYYDEFDLIPSRYRDLLRSGTVLVTNWHAFLPTSPHRDGTAVHRVVDKGEESAQAFTLNRLGELASRLPILVLNDEGHHCWRPAPGTSVEEVTKRTSEELTPDQKKALQDDVEEARVWLAGLDRINNSHLAGEDERGIIACVDLSATPFYLSNSGYPEGSPFPWLVSDFGLVDAIECGIVKVPRLPIQDDTTVKDELGRPDPKYFRLWKNINDSLKPSDYAGKRPKPDAIYRKAEGALTLLAAQWRKRFNEVCEGSIGDVTVPPVMIVVCDSVDVAEVFYEKISGETTRAVSSEDGKKLVLQTVYGPSAVLPEFANVSGARRTVRIDTDLLSRLETRERQTRDEAAQALREVIDTVGKRGGSGEQVRCVVSVSMLTEGWDATNVTHILGVRAFGSQLLCEQVVGRGLRRMSYLPDSDGYLPAEYVDVYGIPFSLIPFKGKSKIVDAPDPVYHHIYALPERAAFELQVPVVESYTYGLSGAGVQCNIDELEGMVVAEEPTAVYLAATRGYEEEGASVVADDDWVRQDRKEYYKSVRFQQIVFRVAQLIVDDLIQGTTEAVRKGGASPLLARHHLFPQVVQLVREYVDRKVDLKSGVDKRELGLETYASLLRERIREGILPAASSRDAPLLPVTNSYKPYTSTADVNYRTTRPVIRLTKSHLNLAMVQGGLERQAIDRLEELDIVECYTPNDRNVGLVIPYRYQGHSHRYEPDFIVKVRGGSLVVLEIKGVKGEVHAPDQVRAKSAAAKKWVAAVNNSRRFGHWAYEICRDVSKLRSRLARHADDPTELPFRTVRAAAREHYENCVPLISLRAAASGWSEEQMGLDPADWAEEWITFETNTEFRPGMFVARVFGASMEPDIPAGSYCLFREAPAGSRQGRKLIVWHSGVADSHTGGHYTLKVYFSEKAEDPDTGWRHTRITLKPLNNSYDSIVVTPEEEDQVRVIAEFVEVVG